MGDWTNVLWTVDLESDSFPKEWTRHDGAGMTADEIAEAIAAGNGVFEFESEDPRFLAVQEKLEELGADFDVFLSERGFPTICW